MSLTLAIILIVVLAVLLVAGLARVMSWPARLRAWPSRPAAPGSAERRRVRSRIGRESRPDSTPTQDADMWR